MKTNLKINYETYKDKVFACWVGKNIGGTMGTPYEGTRDILDVKGFITKPGFVYPNDDLDLQLVWLYALEQNGPHAINTAMLGEHWLSFITPHWNEYGIGKVNLKRGLPSPTSGDYENDWQHSNGAWIRTEIWACAAPGMPHVAAKYAIEDAMVDHGAGEGTFAAAFVAALQSAAFVISDLRKCIEIGLASIPEECRMAKSIRFVMECYDKGMSWLDTRIAVQKLNADIGDGWFEAPSNVAYTAIGLLWGEGDFKKSMIYAINCGDDTDCTAATVGATLGILYGNAGIPEDWRQHIGDEIITISIARGNNGRSLPTNCTDLSNRVIAVAPSVMYAHSKHIPSDFYFSCEFAAEDQIPENVYDTYIKFAKDDVRAQTTALKPYTTYYENVLLNARLTLSAAPDIRPQGEISVSATFSEKACFEREARNLTFRWILPEGFTAEGRQTAMIAGFSRHCDGSITVDFKIKAGDVVAPVNRCTLEVTSTERPTPLYCSFVLLG